MAIRAYNPSRVGVITPRKKEGKFAFKISSHSALNRVARRLGSPGDLEFYGPVRLDSKSRIYYLPDTPTYRVLVEQSGGSIYSRYAPPFEPYPEENPLRKNLFGLHFGKRSTKVESPAPRSTMTIAKALPAAFRAGQASGDTGLFRGWLEGMGLAGRGKVLRARLEREYRRGVEQGEEPERKVSAKGKGIYKDGDVWRWSGDPESEFESRKEAERFVKGQRNPIPQYRGVGYQTYKPDSTHWGFSLDIPTSEMVDAYSRHGESFTAYSGMCRTKADAESQARLMIDQILRDRNPSYRRTLSRGVRGAVSGAQEFVSPSFIAGQAAGAVGGVLDSAKRALRNPSPSFDPVHDPHGALAEIQAQLATPGNVVQVTTYLKSTVYEHKHAGMFKATNTGLYVQRGKRWDDISRTSIRFGKWVDKKQNPSGGTLRLPVHLRHAADGYRVLPVVGPLGTITLEAAYPTRKQAEQEMLALVDLALKDWKGKVELEFVEVGRG
jgi:hypothetical protein